MVPARLRLYHHGPAGRVQPGEQHRRFDLRRGDRGAVFDRDRLGRAFEQDRAAPAFGLGQHLRAHEDERIEDAPHRPAAQRGVAVEARRDGVAADDAHHQAHPGAGVAEIEGFARRKQRSDAAALDDPATGPGPRNAGAERAARRRRVQHVFAFKQALDRGFADAEQAEESTPGAKSIYRPAA